MWIYFCYDITNCNTTFGIQNIKLIEHILALYQKVFGQSNGMKHNCRAMTKTRYAQYLLKSVTRLTFHCAILS